VISTVTRRELTPTSRISPTVPQDSYIPNRKAA
jgi:hypothetical protein